MEDPFPGKALLSNRCDGGNSPKLDCFWLIIHMESDKSKHCWIFANLAIWDFAIILWPAGILLAPTSAKITTVLFIQANDHRLPVFLYNIM
jgi:hypothetical protein